MSRRLSAAAAAQLGPALAALAAYAPALRHGFAFDDEPAILYDGRVHDLARLPDLLTQPYWPHRGTLWRPVTSAAYALLWAVRGAPWVFHAATWLLHAVLAALVARLALRWLPAPAAAAAGLVFALHPVHVEVVANAVGLAELLCALGLVVVLLAATRDGPPTLGRLRLVSLGAFVALGAKEVGAVAPMLALAGAWVAGRHARWAWRTAWWAATPVAALLVARRLVLGTLAGDAPHPAWWIAWQWKGLWLALATVPKTAWLLLVPRPGVWEHSPTAAAADHPDLVLAALGAALVAALAAVAWRTWRRPSVAALAATIALAGWFPVSNLLLKTGVILAERTLYAASIGMALGAGAAYAALARWRPPAATAALVVWAGLGAALTWRDLPAWRDSRAVFEAMVARNPASYKAWWYLAQERLSRGDQAGAYEGFRRSLADFDLETKVLHAGAQQAIIARDTAQAIRWLDRALEIDAGGRRSRTLRVMLAMKTGDTTVARRLLDEGLAREPDQVQWREWRSWLPPAPPGAPATPPPTRR